MQQVRENGMDLTGWLDYFTGGLATQLDEIKAAGTQAIQADLVIQKHDLNDRQADAIRFLVENQRLTIADMEQICPGVNRRTLQRDLKQMEEAGIVERKGAARQSLYSLHKKAL